MDKTLRTRAENFALKVFNNQDMENDEMFINGFKGIKKFSDTELLNWIFDNAEIGG